MIDSGLKRIQTCIIDDLNHLPSDSAYEERRSVERKIEDLLLNIPVGSLDQKFIKKLEKKLSLAHIRSYSLEMYLRLDKYTRLERSDRKSVV
jgi:hypothetical protein